MEVDQTDKIQEDTNSASNKKQLRKKILDQLEFYFSDSNLTKDRFLKQEIKNSTDGFIYLTTFLQFNKIRNLGANLKEIRKSIKKSDLLELNEDESMVRRKTQFVELTQKEIDKKTIYVENVPAKLTNEDFKTYFEQFGKISYISLPKFQTTNQPKGFAFIEFDQKSDSKRAIEAFNDQSGEQDDKPIGKFPKCNAQIIELEKKIKKLKQEISSMEPEDSENDQKTSGNKREIDSDNEPEKKKAKQISKAEKSKKEWFNNLRVVSKKKWLKSKEKFLQNQKLEMGRLKEELNELNKKLNDLKNDQRQKIDEAKKPDDVTSGCILKIELNLNDPKDYEIFSMGRNRFREKYLSTHEDKIAYVDLEKNSNKILIRCKSNQFAQEILKDKTCLENFSKTLLQGEEENTYFEKIVSNRNKKHEKKERKEKQKSDKKITEIKQNSNQVQVETKSKHVKFDDNDN
ncbi:la-related 7-like [Brachionus plicatilis]|uniref:La-related 7-like n=1 Tax=Brachionus plicatilis TaxID=10195 RepID=A0A3M7RYQ5_BRAPC|nr:la-related 7-like [Brachionus plicatilis]